MLEEPEASPFEVDCDLLLFRFFFFLSAGGGGGGGGGGGIGMPGRWGGLLVDDPTQFVLLPPLAVVTLSPAPAPVSKFPPIRDDELTEPLPVLFITRVSFLALN